MHQMENNKCQHKETQYEPTINEDGWICMNCRAKLGFRPDLDRRDTRWKIFAILNIIHDNRIDYVSNGSEEDGIMWGVAQDCKKANRYDQNYIAQRIMAHMDIGEGKYWKEQAKLWQPKEQAKFQ